MNLPLTSLISSKEQTSNASGLTVEVSRQYLRSFLTRGMRTRGGMGIFSCLMLAKAFAMRVTGLLGASVERACEGWFAVAVGGGRAGGERVREESPMITNIETGKKLPSHVFEGY